MKLPLILIPAIILALTTIVIAQEKYHPLDSYSVTYELGGIQKGTKKLVSLDYGTKECIIEQSETDTSGHITKTNNKIIKVITNGEQWITTINLDNKTGTKIKNPLFESIASGIEKEEFNEALIRQMGGEKKGVKEVNGEQCTEWTTMASGYACITNDQILLESGANMSGISVSETAIEVKRNGVQSKDICDIGNVSIKEIDLQKMRKKK